MIWNVELCVAGGNVKTGKLFLFESSMEKLFVWFVKINRFKLKGCEWKGKEKPMIYWKFQLQGLAGEFVCIEGWGMGCLENTLWWMDANKWWWLKVIPFRIKNGVLKNRMSILWLPDNIPGITFEFPETMKRELKGLLYSRPLGSKFLMNWHFVSLNIN